MKMYKWWVSMYPGNYYKSMLVLLGWLLFTYPLAAQEYGILIPFKQSAQLGLSHIRMENNFFQPFNEESVVVEKKSASKAFFYSLILPGTGEAYVGEKVQWDYF